MKKAIIVDDEPTTRRIIAKLLEPFGISGIHASNGHEGFETLESNSDATLAFVDWKMPIMTGIQLVQKIRESEQFSGLKIVMVTTQNDLPHIKEALAEGVDEYIMKPFTKEVFQEKLALLGIVLP